MVLVQLQVGPLSTAAFGRVTAPWSCRQLKKASFDHDSRNAHSFLRRMFRHTRILQRVALFCVVSLLTFLQFVTVSTVRPYGCPSHSDGALRKYVYWTNMSLTTRKIERGVIALGLEYGIQGKLFRTETCHATRRLITSCPYKKHCFSLQQAVISFDCY